MYKLIALDMDGTLLREDKTISPAVKEAIAKAKAKGVKVVLSTGRPINGINRYLKELNLLEDGDIASSFNGGLVLETKSENVIYQCHMPKESFEELYTLSQQLNVHIHALTKDAVLTPNKDISKYSVLEAFINDIYLYYEDSSKLIGSEDYIKIMFIDHPEKLDKAIQQLPDWVYEKYNVAKSADHFLEILPKEVDKGLGLVMLADKLGIKIEETIGVGDAGNDLNLIKSAGLGVAMGNAFDFVKEAADYVTKTNEEDGVAEVINKFILKEQ